MGAGSVSAGWSVGWSGGEVLVGYVLEGGVRPWALPLLVMGQCLLLAG